MIGAAFVALGILASTIQWGWQKLDDGGEEYVVQVEPQLADLDTFRKQGFVSYVPPGLRDIRRIRIVMGSDPLPNEGDMNPVGLSSTAPPPTSQPPASQPQPAAPATLPAGVSAEPLKNSRPIEPPSTKVALADGHQPADATGNVAAGNGNEPTSDSKTSAAERAKQRSPSDGPEGDEPAAISSAGSATTPPRPWLTLLAVAGGLIVSLSGNIFLGWIHWGTRNQYRALVSQLRAQRSA
jgi:hypothetical protein